MSTLDNPKPIDATPSLLNIDLTHLHPNPHQPRRTDDESSLKELTASIKANGLLQPILVRRAAPPHSDDHFVIIAGHRRVEAFRRLQAAASTKELRQSCAAIPAWEHPTRLTEDSALLAMVENIQRSDLTPLEEAEGLARIRDLQPELKTASELSMATGLNEERVRRLLRLREAPQVIKDAITKGMLVTIPGNNDSLEGSESAREKRQHARLDLMAALEFQKLHKHLLRKLPPRAADERIARTVHRALRDRWGKERVVSFVKAALLDKPQALSEVNRRPVFRSTPSQLVLYRDRIDSLVTAERQVLREELQKLLAQLSTSASPNTFAASAPVLKPQVTVQASPQAAPQVTR